MQQTRRLLSCHGDGTGLLIAEVESGEGVGRPWASVQELHVPITVPPMLVMVLETLQMVVLDKTVECGQHTGVEWVLLRFDRVKNRGCDNLEGLDEDIRLGLGGLPSVILETLLPRS